jgi:hypothetical protein
MGAADVPFEVEFEDLADVVEGDVAVDDVFDGVAVGGLGFEADGAKGGREAVNRGGAEAGCQRLHGRGG